MNVYHVNTSKLVYNCIAYYNVYTYENIIILLLLLLYDMRVFECLDTPLDLYNTCILHTHTHIYIYIHILYSDSYLVIIVFTQQCVGQNSISLFKFNIGPEI